MSDTEMMSNRRRHPRIPYCSSLKIKVKGKEFYSLNCEDISMGGMRISIDQNIGKIVKRSKGKLWLKQEYEKENIEFEAHFKVLWVDTIPSGNNDLCMGIEFIKMKRKHQENLLRLLQLQGTIES